MLFFDNERLPTAQQHILMSNMVRFDEIPVQYIDMKRREYVIFIRYQLITAGGKNPIDILLK